MCEVARRMTETYDFTVSAVTKREGARRVQGLQTHVPDSFEPVRNRRLFGRKWDETQRVDAAASRTGRLLRAAGALCDSCGHPVGYHPGFTAVRACAVCIAEEDDGRMTPEEMCRAEFRRPMPI
jgi:hypothetical protein